MLHADLEEEGAHHLENMDSFSSYRLQAPLRGKTSSQLERNFLYSLFLLPTGEHARLVFTLPLSLSLWGLKNGVLYLEHLPVTMVVTSQKTNS